MADFDAQRKKRLEELEMKKKRLEEMRKSKAARETEEDAGRPAQAPTSPLPSSSSASSADARAQVDDLVQSLLGSGSSISSSTSSSSSSSAKTPAVVYEDGLCVACGKPEHISAPTTSETAMAQTPAPVAETPPPPPPPPLLRPETYDKTTQTEDASEMVVENPDEREGERDGQEVCPTCKRTQGHPSPTRAGHRRRLGSDDETLTAARRGSGLGSTLSSNLEDSATSSSGSARIRPPLTDDEAARIVNSDGFQSFLSRSSRVIEKLLDSVAGRGPGGASIDPFKDYRGSVGGRGAEGSTMSLVRSIASGVAGRPIMSIAFSPHHPELYCVAYGSSPADDMYPGCVYVWSTAFSGAEFKFSATSPVLCAAFHPTEPHIVLGACYSGQVLVWDMRGSGATGTSLEPPLQRRASAQGHKHPVYCLAFAQPGHGASSSGLELLTVSSDGSMCHWDISAAALKGPLEPLLSVSLSVPDGAGTETCPAISSLSFSQHPSSADCQGVLGTGTGQLYKTTLPYKANGRVEAIDAHSGLVTAIRLHPSPAKACRNLLLSSSLDWTVKLWNLSLSSQPVLEFRTGQYDYVCDVTWCPVNPAVFATATTGGVLSLWNIARSVSEPIDTLNVVVAFKEAEAVTAAVNAATAASAATSSTGGAKNAASSSSATSTSASGADLPSAALNKMAWSRDGRLLVLGDCAGRCFVVAVRDIVLDAQGADGGRFELAVTGTLPVPTAGTGEPTLDD